MCFFRIIPSFKDLFASRWNCSNIHFVLIATNLSCLESVPEIHDESQVVNTYSKLVSFLYITHILKGES